MVIHADTALAWPEVYEGLEERGVKYAMRLPTSQNLKREIGELLTRPSVRYKGFLYRVAS